MKVLVAGARVIGTVNRAHLAGAGLAVDVLAHPACASSSVLSATRPCSCSARIPQAGAIPATVPGEVALGFPGLGAVIRHGEAEYVRVRQQPTAVPVTSDPGSPKWSARCASADSASTALRTPASPLPGRLARQPVHMGGAADHQEMARMLITSLR
jgi:hypothetical protein